LRTASFGALLLGLCVAPLKAQSGRGVDGIGTGGNNTIQGRVYLPGGSGSDLRIKVRLESTDMANLSTITDANGSFRFSGLQGGNYTIIIDGNIDGDNRFETYKEPITIDRQTGLTGRSPRVLTVPIYLRPKVVVSPETRTGTVDVSLASVPPAALELYNKGLEASKKGDSRAAVEHLKGALALHSQFPLALNELGVQS
jgi:hypothetical protein